MRKSLMVVALLVLAISLGGCALLNLGGDKAEPSAVTNGTTNGNIINFGFGVQYGDELVFLYTGEGVYPTGSVVRSNPETGESSMLQQSGGLYMSIVRDELYYCTPDGVYKTALDTPKPQFVLDKSVSQLQIVDDDLYYIENGAIDSRTTSGEENGFSRVENANWLNVYEQKLYYVNTQDGYIYSANMDGSDPTLLFEHRADMLIVERGNAYFIDSVTGHIRLIPKGTRDIETVVEFACSGFNVNNTNLYYTRIIDGVGTCCLARLDGSDEEILSDFGDSDWHIACMWGDGAIVLRIEDLPAQQRQQF